MFEKENNQVAHADLEMSSAIYIFKSYIFNIYE